MLNMILSFRSVRKSDLSEQRQASKEEKDIGDEEHTTPGVQRIDAFRHPTRPDRIGRHGR